MNEGSLDVEKLYQTLARIIGEREGVNIAVKVTKKKTSPEPCKASDVKVEPLYKSSIKL